MPCNQGSLRWLSYLPRQPKCRSTTMPAPSFAVLLCRTHRHSQGRKRYVTSAEIAFDLKKCITPKHSRHALRSQELNKFAGQKSAMKFELALVTPSLPISSLSTKTTRVAYSDQRHHRLERGKSANPVVMAVTGD